MKRSFAKAVAVVGASFALGLVVEVTSAASAVSPNAGSKVGATIVVAGDRIRTRDRKKDGSCQVSQDRIRTRDRKKDGSCQVSQDQIRKRDPKRDGSCTS